MHNVLLFLAIVLGAGLSLIGAVIITWLLLSAWEARKARQRKAANWEL